MIGLFLPIVIGIQKCDDKGKYFISAFMATVITEIIIALPIVGFILIIK